MTSHIIHRDKPCAWVLPRPSQDASARFRKHGKVRSMQEPSWLDKLLGRSA